MASSLLKLKIAFSCRNLAKTSNLLKLRISPRSFSETLSQVPETDQNPIQKSEQTPNDIKNTKPLQKIDTTKQPDENKPEEKTIPFIKLDSPLARDCSKSFAENMKMAQISTSEGLEQVDDMSLFLPQEANALVFKNFATTKSVQSVALPAVMTGRNVVLVSPFGTGKTFSYLLPLFKHCLINKKSLKIHHPTALILLPTNTQTDLTWSEVSKYAEASGVRGLRASNSLSDKYLAQALYQPADFIISTPEKIASLAKEKLISLDSVSYVALDEGDDVVSGSKAGKSALDFVMDSVHPKAQTVLVSNEYTPAVDSFVSKRIQKPILIKKGLLMKFGAEFKNVPQNFQIVDQRERIRKIVLYLSEITEKHSNILAVFERKWELHIVRTVLGMNGKKLNSVYLYENTCPRLISGIVSPSKNSKVIITYDKALPILKRFNKEIDLLVHCDLPADMDVYINRLKTIKISPRFQSVAFVTDKDRPSMIRMRKTLEISGISRLKEVTKLTSE